ncbi:MAG: DUF4342 domain-containing protein [Bryobacteraceae bacterium]
MALQDFVEEVHVLARDLVDKVRSLIHEGNVQRIIIKDDHGNTLLEIPVSVAAIGVILAPVLAAVGAISALVAKFTIVVERAEPRNSGTSNTPGASARYTRRCISSDVSIHPQLCRPVPRGH